MARYILDEDSTVTESDPAPLKSIRAQIAAERAKRAAVPVAAPSDRPRCCYCRKTLRLYFFRGEPGHEGRLYGDYGDNLFCGLRCGHAWAVAHLKARD